MKTLRRAFSVLRAVLRNLSGEDGYDAYLRHWRAHHTAEGDPLTRGKWFREETARRWNGGPRRCC